VPSAVANDVNVSDRKANRVLMALFGICSIVGICWIVSMTAAAQERAMTGRVEGTVFVQDSQGRSYVAGAKIVLSGTKTLEAKTDQEGKFAIVGIAVGTYTISAQAPGLEGAEAVTVKAGTVTHIALQLKPSQIKSSVTVTETAPQISGPSSAQTISSQTVAIAPNPNERVESLLPLIPGVVRGPDGRINMKGTRNTQSGALVNSANVTDPGTGSPGLDVPIDVVASVQVISNPYDPQYGKLTGAVSSIDTKTGNYEKFHFSIQNLLPRARVREGTVCGIGAATPRLTFTGPVIEDRIAFTQSIEYRFVRTPVNSLPPFQRDMTLQSVNSYTQFDLNLTDKQTATVSFADYPQKLQYMGLNTFMPQPSAPDYHQRGYQLYVQHRYATGTQSLLTSQFSYKTFDADITPNSSGPYQLLVETTEGGFFNMQARRSSRFDWLETYQFAPRHFWGTHQWKIGLNYAHSSYDARQAFMPVEIIGVSGAPIERISFSAPGSSSIDQNELAWFLSDQWIPLPRLTLDLGLRFDRDSITDSTHVAPRAGFQLALTRDAKTLLKGGAGLFYDRVPLMIPSFPALPDRTVSLLDASGQVTASTFYVNQIEGKLRNPRSAAWNLALSRQIIQGLTVQIGYEWRKTTGDFVVAPAACSGSCVMSLSNRGNQSYRELQISGRYQFRRHMLNAAYVRSRVYGDLNDFFQFFGNVPKPVIQPDGYGRLSFDAPNRVLAWGEFKGRWKLTIVPVYDLHTGFPYSVQDVFRDYIGPRNTKRFPQFASLDLQVLRPFSIPMRNKHIKGRAGFSVFNLFNHFNPRDVQTIAESPRFGQFFNDAWREYRGKLVFGF